MHKLTKEEAYSIVKFPNSSYNEKFSNFLKKNGRFFAAEFDRTVRARKPILIRGYSKYYTVNDPQEIEKFIRRAYFESNYEPEELTYCPSHICGILKLEWDYNKEDV